MIYSKISFKYGEDSYELEMKGTAEFDEDEIGFRIKATDVSYFLNGDKINLFQLRNKFSTYDEKLIDSLYERAYSLPKTISKEMFKQ